MVKAVFFDLGETLVTQNIEDNMVTKQALNEIAKLLPRPATPGKLFKIYQQGYRVNQALRSRHHVEIPVHNWMRQLLRRAMGEDPEEGLLERAISIIVDSRSSNTVAFRDAMPALEKLAQGRKKLAIISNISSHQVAVEILKRVRLTRFFDHVVTSAQTGIRKPDPGIFLYALMQFGIRPGEAIHVGDSEEHDVRGAKSVGMKTVLVSRRGYGEATLADYRFRSLAEAADLFGSL